MSLKWSSKPRSDRSLAGCAIEIDGLCRLGTLILVGEKSDSDGATQVSWRDWRVLSQTTFELQNVTGAVKAHSISH
jgi:hypothetical protein